MVQLEENRELLRCFRAGERAALATVYQGYVRPVFALLTHGFEFESNGKKVAFTGFTEPADVESLTQEVFTRAFAERARLAYDGLRPYRNYLFSIARNLVADEFRRRTRHFVALDDAQAEVEAVQARTAPAPSGVQGIEDGQLTKHLTGFLAALDTTERAVFAHRFEEGRSIDDTATALGVTTHQVKSMERRMRKQLFSMLRRHGYFEGYEWRGTGLSRAGFLLLLLEVGG